MSHYPEFGEVQMYNAEIQQLQGKSPKKHFQVMEGANEQSNVADQKGRFGESYDSEDEYRDPDHKNNFLKDNLFGH